MVPLPADIDLAELELEEGPEVARWITRLRAARDLHGRLVIRNAPQCIAHTLYRTGMLDERILLVDPRSDELGPSS